MKARGVRYLAAFVLVAGTAFGQEVPIRLPPVEEEAVNPLRNWERVVADLCADLDPVFRDKAKVQALGKNLMRVSPTLRAHCLRKFAIHSHFIKQRLPAPQRQLPLQVEQDLVASLYDPAATNPGLGVEQWKQAVQTTRYDPDLRYVAVFDAAGNPTGEKDYFHSKREKPGLAMSPYGYFFEVKNGGAFPLFIDPRTDQVSAANQSASNDVVDALYERLTSEDPKKQTPWQIEQALSLSRNHMKRHSPDLRSLGYVPVATSVLNSADRAAGIAPLGRAAIAFERVRQAAALAGAPQYYFDQIEQNLSKALANPAPFDSCEMVCGLLDRAALWRKNGDGPLGSAAVGSRALAYLSLQTLFISSAAPLCYAAAGKDPAKQKAIEALQEQTFKEWFAGISDLIKKGKNPQDLDPTSPYPAYAHLFSTLVFNQMLHGKGDMGSREKLRKMLESPEHQKSWAGGSNLNHRFGYSLMTLGLGGDSGEVSVSRLRQQVVTAALASSEMMNQPYDMAGRIPNPRIGNAPPQRAAVARNVPIFFSLFLKEEPQLWESYLWTALEDFTGRYGGSLRLHVGRDWLHSPHGDHMNRANEMYSGIAPYYFPPAAAVASGALAQMEIARPDQASKTQSGMADMKLGLDYLYDPSTGLFHAPGKVVYPDGDAWIQPLMGLAMLPLVNQCGGVPVPRQFGMFDAGFASRELADTASRRLVRRNQALRESRMVEQHPGLNLNR